jgi:hypothetical protein
LAPLEAGLADEAVVFAVVFGGVFGVFSSAGAILASAAISRDLRREALLACSTPFSAALSSALIARRTSSLVRLTVSPTAGRRARETSVLTAERLARFRFRLRNEARTRFFADWVFAMRAVIIASPPGPGLGCDSQVGEYSERYSAE